MNKSEDLEALEQDIKESINNNEYGLIKLKDIVIDTRELEEILSNISMLKNGYNIAVYEETLTEAQKEIYKAYNIDIFKGEDLASLKEIKAERNKEYEDKNN